MFSKATTLFALFAAAAHVVVASPPACLIGAMSTQQDPSNIKNVCTSGAKTVEAYLCANCTSYSTEAWNSWTSQCKSAGVTISSSTCSNSTSSSSSSTASATSTKSSAVYSSGMIYPTGASSGFATATVGPNGNGTLATSAGSAPTAAQSGSGGASATSGGSSATSTPVAANVAAGVARLGMDVVGLVAVGAFGAMLL